MPVNFNPRSPYGERRTVDCSEASGDIISIHAPLTGSDFAAIVDAGGGLISIHAPLTGSDRFFLKCLFSRRHFNPRSPYGERPQNVGSQEFPIWISIHAPLTGSDLVRQLPGRVYLDFNPRSPYGERQNPPPGSKPGGDFNPRSPYGERLDKSFGGRRAGQFQSTLPLRGATIYKIIGYTATRISIHAPLTGSDFRFCSLRWLLLYFNPRSPYGERPSGGIDMAVFISISIHAPLTGSDPPNAQVIASSTISIHAPLTGSDFPSVARSLIVLGFQSTLPLRGAT